MKRLSNVLIIFSLLAMTPQLTKADIVYYEDFNSIDGGGYFSEGPLNEWSYGPMYYAPQCDGQCWGTEIMFPPYLYESNCNQTLNSITIDLSLVNFSQPVILSFDYYLDTEPATSPPLGDLASFYYLSTEGWVRIWRDSGHNATWLHYETDISNIDHPVGQTIALRWNLNADSDNLRGYGLHIDNVKIEGTLVPIPSAVWLLGFGLLGIVGVRRKFNN